MDPLAHVKIVKQENTQAVQIYIVVHLVRVVGKVDCNLLRAKCVRQASIKVETIVTIVNLGRWHRWAAPVVHLV